MGEQFLDKFRAVERNRRGAAVDFNEDDDVGDEMDLDMMDLDQQQGEKLKYKDQLVSVNGLQGVFSVTKCMNSNG